MGQSTWGALCHYLLSAKITKITTKKRTKMTDGFEPTSTTAIIIYVVGGVSLLIIVGIIVFCCRRKKMTTSQPPSNHNSKKRVTKQSDSRVILETGRNAISDDVWNPKVSMSDFQFEK